MELELPIEEVISLVFYYSFINRQQFSICGRVIAIHPFEFLREELDSMPFALSKLLEDRPDPYQRRVYEDSHGSLHILEG